MTTISRTTTTTTTTTTYNNNVGSDAASKASQLAQLTQTLNELTAKLNAASSQSAAPAQSEDGMMETTQAPVDLSGGASAPKQMDAYSAAKTLSDHFALTDGVGFDGRGGNSGDGLIGQRDLEQIVKPDSGAPPELKAAAQFMMDHKAVASAVSQGRGVTGDDTLMSKKELDAFAASGPKSASASPAANPNLLPTMSSSMMSQLGRMGNTGAASAPKQTFAPQAQAQAPASKPMDVYGAAQAIKKHFALAEGVGFDGRGGNSGDNRLGRFDVEQLVKPDSGAPAELKEAARFLLDHPMMAEAMVGDRSTGTITPESLDKFLASAPKSAPAPQNLMPMMSASLMSQLGRMG